MTHYTIIYLVEKPCQLPENCLSSRQTTFWPKNEANDKRTASEMVYKSESNEEEMEIAEWLSFLVTQC